jgi:hypothetical protein
MGELIKNIEIDQEWFEKILPQVCDIETSQDPEGWQIDNPLWGHCAVVALLAQNFWGGNLLRASLSSVKGFEHMRSHYWNQLKDGTEVDFTKSQFKDNYPNNLQAEIRAREYVLSYPETAKRYELLRSRILKLLHAD